METMDVEWGEAPAFSLRDYQRDWIERTKADRAAGFSRLLLDAVGGSGKTTYAGALAKEAWSLRKGRTLILENREQLVLQTAKRFRDETGLEVDVEMADAHASPHAAVVVASVASLGRMNRLTGFAADHFEYVFADEAHNSTSNLFLRIMRYHHYGAESLTEGWTAPKDGTYTPLACVIGITATPDTHGKRNLGNFYQKFVARYSYLQAIEDGWLVGIKEVNIPVTVDTRKFRRKMTGQGKDFSAEDVATAIIPEIEAIAEQVATLAKDRKTMCYWPTKECAMLGAAAMNRRGLKALYVLGECLDRDEKTDEYMNHGPGIALNLCAMYVEGTDIPSTDAIGWFRPTESPSFYKQGLYRMSRPLPGIVNDDMTAEERRAAIAASRKQYGLLISPFYVSDSIDLMRVTDLFVDAALREKTKKMPKEFTDPQKIRDFIAALEKAADKHANKQPRTINPLTFALAIGDAALAHYEPKTSQDSAPPTREELDVLLGYDLDTSAIKTSGQAQLAIARIRQRGELGLATPKQLSFLKSLTKLDEKTGQRVPMFKEEALYTMKAAQAGAIAGRMQAKWRGRETHA